MATPYKITVVPNSPSVGYHEVQVDGHDISLGVRDLRLEIKPGHLPRVELELQVHEIHQLQFETAELIIPDGTRDALIAMGWTPPALEAL